MFRCQSSIKRTQYNLIDSKSGFISCQNPLSYEKGVFEQINPIAFNESEHSDLHNYEDSFPILLQALSSQGNVGREHCRMLKRFPKSEMHKVSLWMHRDDYVKIVKLSGDLSLNTYLNRLIRQGISQQEKTQTQMVGA